MSLIKTIDEFKKYIGIDYNAKMRTLQPFIESAELMYLKDILGAAFMAELQAAYDTAGGDVDSLSDATIKGMFPFLQRCIANYALLLSINHISVSFGDMGVRQNRAEDSDAAPRWAQEKLQFQALRDGDLHADLLLKYLEENATAVNSLATWFASSYNTATSGYIVYSTEIASKHISINSSRRVFLAVRPKMQEIERRVLPKLIGQAQLDELVSELKAGTLTDVNKALVAMIEPIVAKMGLYLQLPFMSISISETGIWLYSGTDQLFDIRFQLANQKDIECYRDQLEGEDDDDFGFCSDKENLRQFILANIADYPLIAATGVYTVQPDPGPTWRPKNDPLTSHFAV